MTYPTQQRRASLFLQMILALAGGVILFFSAILAWTLGYQLIYAGRIFPGVSVAGVDLSGLAPNDAAVKLSQTLSYPMTGKILFRDGEQVWVASPLELGMAFDPSASAQAAYRLGRSDGLFGALQQQIRSTTQGANLSPVLIWDQRVAYRYLQNIAATLDQPVVEASLQVQGGEVIATPGQKGRSLNVPATLTNLAAQLQSFRDGEVPLVIDEISPKILDVSAQAEVARNILSQPLTLVIPNAQPGEAGPWVYDVPVIAHWLSVERLDNGDPPQIRVRLDPKALRDALTDLAPLVNRQPANARFYFDDNTHQLVLIESAKTGRTLNVEASIEAINEALGRGEHTIPLQIVETQPAVTDSATAEQLGITQLVGAHTTYFYGSSAARIQNIQAAAARFHGVLVAPGETFSMGQTLGDISLENGFAEALIIYGGRTIKGVGGGVCQVSTTLFRAVFFAGFPVVERYSHAYRVSYYEQTASGGVDPNLAGLDATVYFPLVDFKFTNDTPYWLLMETYVNPAAHTLTWKLYSTSDGRSVTYETTGPQNLVPAPKPLFEVNPELDAGQIKQVDWAANGADVVVTRTVWRNGQIYFQDTFRTHYELWQAICQYGPGTKNPEKEAKRQGLCQPPSY